MYNSVWNIKLSRSRTVYLRRLNNLDNVTDVTKTLDDITISEKLCDFISKCKSKKIGHIRSIEERKQGMIDNGLEDEITEELINDWQKEIDEYGNMKQEKVIL